jgi:hypothetical protein
MAATAAKQEQVVPPKTLGEIPSGLTVPQAPKRTIYQRMNAVMKDVRGVGKHSSNPQGGYKYAGHEAVTEALRDAYVRHGIIRTANVVKTEILDRGLLVLTVRISWICDDEPSSRHEVEMPGLQSSVKKDGGMAPVQVGMALSYAVKNAEFKCFSLTGDDTPDTEAEDDDRGESRYDEREQGNPGQGLAVEYLGRFTEVRSTEELDALKKEIRANWANVKTVQGIAERMVEAQRKAQQRLRERQPGED